MTTQLKASLLLVGVFLIGAIAGGGVSFAYTQRDTAKLLETEPTDFRARRFLSALARELDLTDQQREAIGRIMETHGPKREQLRELFERCGEPLRRQRAEVESRIRAVLSPEQQQRFDEISDKHHRRFLFDRSHRRHRGPPDRHAP